VAASRCAESSAISSPQSSRSRRAQQWKDIWRLNIHACLLVFTTQPEFWRPRIGRGRCCRRVLEFFYHGVSRSGGSLPPFYDDVWSQPRTLATAVQRSRQEKNAAVTQSRAAGKPSVPSRTDTARCQSIQNPVAQHLCCASGRRQAMREQARERCSSSVYATGSDQPQTRPIFRSHLNLRASKPNCEQKRICERDDGSKPCDECAPNFEVSATIQGTELRAAARSLRGSASNTPLSTSTNSGGHPKYV